MSKIREPRLNVMPIEYEWAYDYWFKQENARWLHTEIPMSDDVNDWMLKMTDQEKNAIGKILKGFGQTESHVNEYWSTYVTKWFPVPEIRDMAIAFAAMETVHTRAYLYLNTTLGLTDFESFLSDDETMAKINLLLEVDPNNETLENIATSIAVFSACTEGINLFSSFAILLSFNKPISKNDIIEPRLRGVGKQIEYSVRDESLHSEAGCKLFNVLCSENSGLKESVKDRIYEAFDVALKLEFDYINGVMPEDLPTIKRESLFKFMYHRANRKLQELGYEAKYELDKSDSELVKDLQWFYSVISGEQQTDFFNNRESQYGLPNADWDSEDLF